MDLKKLKEKGERRYPSPLTLIIGEPGAGKTYLAAKAATHLGDTLLVDCDQGGYQHDIPRFPVATIQGLYEILTALRDAEEREFTTVIIDHMKNIDEMFTKELLSENVAYQNGEKRLPIALSDPFCSAFGYQNGFNMLAAKWGELFKFIKNVRNRKNITFLIVGHSMTVKKDLGGELSEQYDVQDVELHASSSRIVRKYADNIFVIDNKATKLQEDNGYQAKAKAKHPVRYKGRIELHRRLVVNEIPRYVAKARIPLPQHTYDISDTEGLDAFWQDFKTTWRL